LSEVSIVFHSLLMLLFEPPKRRLTIRVSCLGWLNGLRNVFIESVLLTVKEWVVVTLDNHVQMA